MKNGCTIRTAVRLVALAGVVGVTTFANAAPPTSANSADKSVVGAAAQAPAKAVKPYTGTAGLGQAKPSEWPSMPKGHSATPGEGVRGTPPNDTCAGIIAVANPSVTAGDTFGAATDVFNDCYGSQGSEVWYSFVGDGTLTTIATCVADYDTQINVYADGCDVTCVASNDDFCGLQSQLQFPAANGVTYYVAVGGYLGAQGNFSMSIAGAGPCLDGALPNDNCDDATAVAIPSNTLGSNIGGSPECATVPTFCGGGGQTFQGVWYDIVGNGNFTRLSTCSPNTFMDTKMFVFSGDCSAPTCVAGNDDDGVCTEPGFDPPYWRASLGFTAAAGETYHILICGYGGSEGDFELLVSEPPPCFTSCPKGGVDENEPDCGLPVDTVNGGCNFFPPLYTTLECGDTVCASAAAAANFRDTDWYQVCFESATEITWSMDESCFNWLIFIIDTGPGGDCSVVSILQVLTGAAGTSGSISACLPPGCYTVWAGPQVFDGIPCPNGYTATLSCVPCSAEPPANDSCDQAIAIECGSFGEYTNQFATVDPIDPFFFCSFGGASQGDNTVWFTFVATGNSATASTCGSTGETDTIIQILDGTCKGGFTEMACNDDACFSLTAEATAFGTLTPGNTYYIEVASWGIGSPGGQFVLSLECFDFVPCELPCKGFEEGETNCGLPTDFTNGGCNFQPEIFQEVFCGTTVCANGAAQGNFRDTDWFEFNTAVPVEVTWTMEDSCFDWLIFIIDLNGGCAGLAILEVLTGPAGTGGSISACLQPGRYSLWAGTQVFDGVPCGDYRASVSCAECPPPCELNCPKGSTDENEPDCGIPVDFVNGGCNSVPPIFSPIECNQTYCGTGGNNGSFRDTDWYSITVTDPIQLTWTVSARFDALIGLVENNGIDSCDGVGFFRFFAFTGGDCAEASVVADLTPGTYWWFVATSNFGGIPCGAEYVATLSGDCGGGADCNKNGIDDADDIAGGTSRDCFDYNAPQVIGGPYTAGGANGIPDECECVADWNRDGIANSTDVGEHINTYFLDQSTLTTIFADVDCNGVSNSADVGEFINTYFAAQANQLPFAGCTI